MRLIIVGCGRWGAGLAVALSRRGHEVTVVDCDPAALSAVGAAFKCRTIAGDALDRGVLLEAGIERADGLAAVTASDEINAAVARVASLLFQVPKVVARLHDPRQVETYRRLGVQVVAPVAWGINRFAELLCFSQLDTVLSLGDGEVDIVEVETPPLLVDRPVTELGLMGEAQVIAITRRSQTFLPMPGASFQAGDRIHLITLASSAERLKALLAMS
jgi:trk system potassium uptake protein TrkA